MDRNGTKPHSDGTLLVSVPEARRQLGGIGSSHFYQLVRNGEIRIVHLGRRSFVAVKQLERLVDSLSEEIEP